MKSLIASILAATIAVTSTATPAMANDREDEIAKLLFGLAAVAIIGKAINDRNDNRRAQVTVTPTRPRDVSIPQNRRVLPSQCFRRIDTWDGPVRMFGRRCLERNYAFADRLPQRCAFSVQGPRHVRYGYRPRCLRNAGFTMARH